MIGISNPPYRELLDILVCPSTLNPLKWEAEQKVLFGTTATTYAVIDGIPNFACDLKVPPQERYEIDVSVLILTLNEAGNIGLVVEGSKSALQAAGVRFEIVVVDGGSTDGTQDRAVESGARVITQSERGYAQALIEGMRSVKGRYVLTLDADCSHNAALIPEFLNAAQPGRIVIGSRWIRGGSFEGPLLRHILSRVLNLVFTRILDIPISDISSGYRLYDRAIVSPDAYKSRDFSILEEIIVLARGAGYDLSEIPLRYEQRNEGRSHAHLTTFALTYLATLKRMLLLRYDSSSADYDSRAFSSLNFVQRWWQRKRFKNVRTLMREYWRSGSVLDVGCGSSRIIQDLPHAVAFDLSMEKLRFLRPTNRLRVCGTALALPFKDEAFDCVVHSQLIEYLPQVPEVFTELRRVLKPKGVLVIGMVDYGGWIWPTIVKAYNLLMPYAYPNNRITLFSVKSLTEALNSYGFTVEEITSIAGAEFTLRAIRN